MSHASTNLKARRVILRSRIIVGLILLGSLALLLAVPGLGRKVSAAEFYARLASPMPLFLLRLFYLIYLPAIIRIYYLLLLDAKGVFTSEERREFRENKLKWERILFRAGLIAGILALVMIALVRLIR